MRTPISVRLSELQERQLAELEESTGMNQSEIIKLAIDRMAREEIKMWTIVGRSNWVGAQYEKFGGPFATKKLAEERLEEIYNKEYNYIITRAQPKPCEDHQPACDLMMINGKLEHVSTMIDYQFDENSVTPGQHEAMIQELDKMMDDQVDIKSIKF
jgi:hypothetical protein